MSVDIILRHPREEDMAQMVAVRNASQKGLGEQRDETFAEVKADIFTEDYDSAGCWIAVEDGIVVGYAVGLVERGRLMAGRKEARIDIEIMPDKRGLGFGSELVDNVLAYARTSGMTSVLIRCESEEHWKMNLLKASGFKDVHHWYRMIRRGRERPEPHPLPPGYRLMSKMSKQLTKEEIGRLVSVSNDAFSETFDFFPMNPEDAERLMLSSEDIDRDAWVEKDGRVVGLCVSEESAGFNKEHGSRMGYIGVLCVLSGHRRGGIGAALLSEGIEWVLDRGMDEIFLAVDAENPGALRLYTEHGFSILREGSYYRVSL